MQLLIPVAAGLEGVVKKQLLSLGYGKAPAENGRIELAGDWADVARLNVFLRSGERVLIKLKEFPAETFDELYDNFYSVPWEEWLALDSKILMDGKSVSSRLAAVKAAGGVAKKAIVRRLADKKRSGRKTLSETGARSVVGFSIYKDRVTVTLDTSGDGLHKRGYRSLAYTAPLKETLAAAIIDLSFYRPETDSEKPFADVFCGSGTLPIEAAMKALRIAPGAERDFDFRHWVCIRGADISSEAISIAKFHARRAGVGHAVDFSVADMRRFQSSVPCGVMICNPPYGERLSDVEEVKTLCRDFGKMFRALPDWSAYILTSFPEFERYFGKRSDRKKKLFNANLACGLYTYFGRRPEEREEF